MHCKVCNKNLPITIRKWERLKKTSGYKFVSNDGQRRTKWMQMEKKLNKSFAFINGSTDRTDYKCVFGDKGWMKKGKEERVEDNLRLNINKNSPKD